MTKRQPAEVFPVGEFLRDILEERGWSQVDLAVILGRSVTMINELMTGKRGVTIDTAKKLAEAFDTTPEFWLNLDQSYKLWLAANTDESRVKRMANLYSFAPVSEMIKRGWIESSENIEILENQVLSFHGIRDFAETPPNYAYAARKSNSYAQDFTIIQRAWFHRAVQLSQSVAVAKFTASSVESATENLKLLLHESREARHVSRVLSELGIRLVIVEPLTGSKIDGACFWLDDSSPVIALSLRFDRIDNFWFTLFHELAHCADREMHIDTDVGASHGSKERPESEILADKIAAANLIDQNALNSFIERKRPLYSANSIIAFAYTMKVHPGIVVGQLHRREEVSWKNLNKLIDPIRSIVTMTTLTDGWGTPPAFQSVA